MNIRHAIPIFFLLSLFLFPTPVHADGIIIPEPPIILPTPTCRPGVPCPPVPPRPLAQLIIRNHQVQVTIQDQVAITRVDQVFFNPNDRPIEGTYIFPLPIGASVSKFTLWVDGKPVDGKVLDAKAARKIYEDIVRRNNDPALLEYTGRGAVQANIFPIPPRGERRIQLEYQQVLTAENGLVRYVYPLNTEKFSAKPLEFVSVDVKINSSQKIRTVYSPSHPISTQKESDFHYRAGYEAKNVLPSNDFTLYYSIGESEALHLLSYRDPSDAAEPDGYFLLLLAPKPGEPARKVAKDVLLVIDQSGSMDGEKFRQAQSALRYILKNLDPEDRFYLSSFSTGIKVYARGMRPASEAAEAIAWVDKLSAQGSTDINRALLEAAAVAENVRPTYLIFLTDGLPTTGVTRREEILKNFAKVASPNLRLFSFGVGYDVDTYLLDTLSQDHHGLSSYVKPSQAIDEVVSEFYAKISTPVLTDLKLDFNSLPVYDLYPDPLPDLFDGSQIVVVGRYRKGGNALVTLSGMVNDQKQVFRYTDLILTEDSRKGDEILSSIPRIWATRKVGNLLNKIRLQGPDQETINQIVRLSIRFGIVTPYTSYLVTEPAPLGVESQQKLAQEQYRNSQAMPTAAPSGQKAVESAQDQGRMAGANQAPSLPQNAEQTVRAVGSRTFLFSNGVWIDTAYDSKKMPTQKIQFLSKDYFSLIDSHPEFAQSMALGNRVIWVADGKAFEIVPEAPSQGQTPPPAPTATRVLPSPTSIENRVKTPVLSPTPTPAGAKTTQTPIVPAQSEPFSVWWLGAAVVLMIGFGWAVWDIWKLVRRG